MNEATDEQHQGICKDTDRSLNSTINHLPDEVLLDIFDFYRQGFGSYLRRTDYYDHEWRRKCLWFNLTHVCRKWRAVMFGSTSRLDLGITVGPIKPGDIETILSGPFPIFINYYCMEMNKDMTDSALWRMRAALKQHDRVREISVAGMSSWFDELFRATSCPFPVLEGLILRSRYQSHNEELKIPDTFLGGPDLSHLHLRRLQLGFISLTSVFRFLLSTSALTDLILQIDTTFGTSPESSLLACFQSMPVLCHLDLIISSSLLESPPQPSTLKDIVTLSKLTYLRYVGQSLFLDAIAAGISAPFLQDFRMVFRDEISSPIVHLPRFINETEKHYHSVDVTLLDGYLHLSLMTQSEYTSGNCHNWLRFKPRPIPGLSTELMRMSGALSTKLTTAEELRISFLSREAMDPEIPCHRFYQQFPSAKVFRIAGINYDRIARTLLQGHLKHVDDHSFTPALEEIELGYDDVFQENRNESELAVFQPFIFARRQAGRPVKVFFPP